MERNRPHVAPVLACRVLLGLRETESIVPQHTLSVPRDRFR